MCTCIAEFGFDYAASASPGVRWDCSEGLHYSNDCVLVNIYTCTWMMMSVDKYMHMHLYVIFYVHAVCYVSLCACVSLCVYMYYITCIPVRIYLHVYMYNICTLYICSVCICAYIHVYVHYL